MLSGTATSAERIKLRFIANFKPKPALMCNLLGGESLDIYAVLYRYKALRDLPENELNEIYEQIAERLGF